MPEKRQTRCWPGYEPVKGKKPSSQGSCRPKADSKLTDSEKEFREKRTRQLNNWQSEHPGTRKSAAQHLHAPGSGTKKKSIKKTAKKTSAHKKTASASDSKKRK